MIKDSGNRREFATGAVRDIPAGKGRCDLLPLDIIGEMFNGDFVVDRVYRFTQDGDVCWLYEVLAEAKEKLFNDYCTMFLEVAKHFEEGCVKYGENNWQKGIPAYCYVDSGLRHYFKMRRGDVDENHTRAFVWNVLCCIWTCQHKPELNSYVKEDAHDD